MNKKQRKTLEAIFRNPVSSSIPWSDIEALLAALGADQSEGDGSRVRFKLNGVKAIFHPATPRTDHGQRRGQIRKTVSRRGRSEAMNTIQYKGYLGTFEYDQDADIFSR